VSDAADGGEESISLVIPTYNRASALRSNLANMLAMRDVSEVIVVNDGSTDETLQVCGEFDSARLKVTSHEVNRGVAAARNSGSALARGEWVLFGEDDCRFPGDYATILRAEAHRHDADIVGAPLLHTDLGEEQLPALAAASRTHRLPSMDDVDVFPYETVETPFLPARALVRARVFESVHYYEGFPVNAYREETDFFVQAARAGFRCVLTPSTYCYQLETWRGGQHHSSSLRYESWVLRNNWRFLRRHDAWLVAQGYIPGARRAQARFALERTAKVLAGASRARLARLRARLRPRDPAPAG
jgi:GT2 family glycosyltransferase